MFYTDIGKGETLVLIHGLGSKKEYWKYQHKFSKEYRLIIPDLRGHGESENYKDISIETFATDILKLLDSLGIKKAHFCGHSMGGVVVQEIYQQKQECVKSIILSNTFSYAPFSIGQIIIKLQEETLSKMTIKEYTMIAAENCLYDKDEKVINELKDFFLIKKEVLKESSASAIKSNYLFMLPFIKVPTLIIGSTNDKVVPVFSFYQTKWFMPNAKLVILDKCGHMSNFEKKEEFNEIVSDFLTEINK